MKKLLIFLIILFISVFFRFYKLNDFPPSLNWDEVSLGYNAYSILKTGKDEWGQFLPLTFRAYGDYKLPIYIYADVPFVALFGLNEWGVRLPSALAGLGIVCLVFLIIKKITGKNDLALLGMFFSATLPWLVIFSRIALEANLALLLFVASFYFFILSEEKKYHLITSAVLLGLSLFTYNSARVLVLPFIILVSILFWKSFKEKFKFSLLSLFIIIAFFIIAFPLAILQDSSARYRWTTILDEGAIQRINELRGSSALPPIASKLAFNKLTYFIPEAFKNYLTHFNADFLFLNGGSNYQYSVPGSGLAPIVLLPLLILGIFQVFRKKTKWQYLVLGWLLLAPTPAAITRDAPHALRTIFMSVPLIIISSLGVLFIIENLKIKKVFVYSFLLAAVLITTTSFWINYTKVYTKKYSWSWQYGYKQVINFINKQGNNYDKIYLSKKYGEPHEFLLFYLKYDPNKYRNDSKLIRYKRSDWYWVDQFDRFEFINDWEVTEKVKIKTGKDLLITSPGNYPVKAKLINRIKFLDGQDAFDIVEL